MNFKNTKAARVRAMLAGSAVVAGLCAALAVPQQTQAKAAYDTKYTDTYSMAFLMAPSLIKNTDPVGTYLQLRAAIRYGTITQGDLWALHQNGIQIPAESLRLLNEGGLINGYLYKTMAGLPYTEADLKDVYDISYYINSNPAITKGIVDGTLRMDEVFMNFLTIGMPYGLQGNEKFNLQYFKANYPNLVKELGEDNASYYVYYMIYGKEKNLVADRLVKKK